MFFCKKKKAYLANIHLGSFEMNLFGHLPTRNRDVKEEDIDVSKVEPLVENNFPLDCKWTIEFIWSTIIDDVITLNENLKSAPV
jgi:hypothetical protein